MKLSIIIVTYNSRTTVGLCLQSLDAFGSDHLSEVIVIDNASNDDTVKFVTEAHPSARLIVSKENIGFAAACNKASEVATGDYILLVNPDVEVRAATIESLLSAIKDHPNAGIWGGRELNPDGTLDFNYCQRFPSNWGMFCRASGLSAAFARTNLFNPDQYGNWQRDTLRPVDVVSGAFMAIGRELWTRLGGFDPTFFMYSEEVDFCFRARKLGFQPIVHPGASFGHLGGASEPRVGRRLALMLCGKVTFMKTHWGPIRTRIGMALLVLWPFSRWLILTARMALQPTNPSVARGLHDWQEVWQARHQWMAGYPRRDEN